MKSSQSHADVFPSTEDVDRNSGLGLLVVALIMLSLLSLFMAQSRELARAYLCQNNLKRLTLGIHQYHSAYRQLPMAAGGTSGHSNYPPLATTDSRSSNQGRLSGMAGLLPFIDQQAAWEQLALTSGAPGSFPSMGPAPSYNPAEYSLWALQIDAFLCPSDSAKKVDYGLRSYMMNYGDGIRSVGRLFNDTAEDLALSRIVGRGMFTSHKKLTFRDSRDGLSNTAMFSETMIGVGKMEDHEARIARGVNGLAEAPSVANEVISGQGKPCRSGQTMWAVGKGSRWAEGFYLVNGFTTVMPPGGPSATVPDDPETGVVSASSYHSDGVHVAMTDGANRFVSRFIDTGDLGAPCFEPDPQNGRKTQTPYGIWGAMGTRSGLEVIPGERQANYKILHGF